MFNCIKALTVLWATTGMASISIRRAGWLDRMVEYHKNKFFEDLRNLPAVHIKAKIARAPLGYVDSQDWDYESVNRLITLIRQSDGAKAVRRALRRSMQSNRRFMSIAESFKAFPSLSKDHDNDFYYDMDAGEYYADTEHFDDHLDEEHIIVVSNPVEARLPSASISVKLLKSILENRAKAGRLMPTTKKKIPWSTTSQKSKASTPDAPKDDKPSSATSLSSTPAPEISNSTGDSAATNQAEEKTTV